MPAGGLVPLRQEDFSGGAWPLQERVPAVAVEDIVNGYIDEQGGIARRGGSTYRGPAMSSGHGPAFWVWDGFLAGGRRTLQGRWSDVYMFDASESAWAARGTAMDRVRPVAIAGMLAGPATTAANVGAVHLAGSNFTSVSSPAGTIALTEGSKTVTGTGTNFLSTVQPGALLVIIADSRTVAVGKVDSDTQLTLSVPYPGGSVSGIAAPGAYVVQSTSVYTVVSTLQSLPASASYVSAAANRLIVGAGSRIAFSHPNDPTSFATDNYHELPSGAYLTGLEGLRDSLLAFTTGGLYAVRNLAYDLTDDAGNPQQSLGILDPDFVLWDEMGIAGWRGSVIAPAVDGLFLLDGAGAPVPLANDPILPLYRSYVDAGYRLGSATVHRSYYYLPVINFTAAVGENPPTIAWVDTLVCDLRRGAWARWDGHAGKTVAFARRVQEVARQPLLLGAHESDLKLSDLTSATRPTAAVKNDADGTTHQLKVTLRTVTMPVQVWWAKFRARFEIDDAASDNPTVTAEYATGRPGNTFTALTGTALEGETTFTWPVRKRARALRIRVTSNNAAAKLVLRGADWFFRPTGRQ